ncbi:MAG TPA: hypothetical protein VFS40_10835 [Gemmatimonadales bacterium]|nr:hypothetical protein [Gemmatimonadales bacterium]
MFRRKQAPPAFVRGCTVYFAPGHDTVLVAALFNHGGLFAEQPDGVARCATGDVPALGAAARAALAACRYEPAFDYRDRKRTDWPAFRASGCRSVREFEQLYVPFGIRGANEANLAYVIESPPYGACAVSLTATTDAHGEDARLGERIACLWREYRRVSGD